MSALRSLLFFFILLIITPPYTTLSVILCFWMPHRARRMSVAPWVAVTNWLVKHLLGIKYTLLGAENIPKDRPVVILCKHQSAWETLVLQELFPAVLFVWKKELKLIPFFGWALAITPSISIDRKAGKEAMRNLLDQGSLRIKQGYSIAIFPEGTRAAPGTQRRYKIGGAYLATETGTAVLPIALNSGEFWGRNAFVKEPGTATVSIGPLIETTGLSADEVNARAEAWIEGEMRRISPHLYETKEPATQS
ncbi:MAG TPA: lysophospholipid acyltransferase family protein [Rhodocyclaceae bacterium]|jgi:1-acyl-sn-glycerol-3-phosphate acyltransferase|nr:lysophospholipid acyltransferase family protein [Rhodocyclaceae bacterium]